jgi:hypothetical protein
LSEVDILIPFDVVLLLMTTGEAFFGVKVLLNGNSSVATYVAIRL